MYAVVVVAVIYFVLFFVFSVKIEDVDNLQIPHWDVDLGLSIFLLRLGLSINYARKWETRS